MNVALRNDLAPMYLGNLVLIAALASSPDAEALYRELDGVAARIEQLKARRMAGESVEGELWPLLVRAQELARELDQARPEPPPAPAAPSDDPARERADELRTQAAALREQAEELSGALATLEARIAAALRAATAPHEAVPTGRSSLPRATLASALTAGSTRPAGAEQAATAIAQMVQQRARLEAHIGALQAEASRLDAEASALDEQQ